MQSFDHKLYMYINLIYADFSQKAIPLPAAVRWKEGYTLEMLSAY